MPIASFRDIALELSTKYDEREKELPKIRGEVIQIRQSTGADSVFVEGRPGYVWVRIFDTDGGVMPILCRLANPIVGMPVTISKMPGSTMLEIISFDDEIARADADYDGLPYLRPHHKEHEMPDGAPGIDAMTVYPRSLSWLKTYQTNPVSLSVNVSQLRYLYEGASTVFNGAAIDLTASVPAAGQARLVLVYLNPVTNTLALTNGAVGAIGAAWALPEPAHTANMIDSAVVRLENGQLTIIETDIRDRRQTLNTGGFTHDVFSATHPDAVTDVVAKGDIPVGNATPQLEPLTVGGTAGHRLVVDAAQAQGMRWGPDFLWPWNDQILLMDAGAANTEYATIALAIAASAAGDTIFVPPGTWTCDSQTLPDGVNLVGLDRDLTIIQTTSQALCLILGNGSYVYNLTIRNVWASAVYIAGVRPPNAPGTATLHDCKIIVSNTNGAGLSPAYGTSGGVSNDGTLMLIETDVTVSNTSAAGWSLGVYANNMDAVIRGGTINAGTTGAVVHDLYCIDDWEIDIDSGVTLVNHAIGGTGLIRGITHDHTLDNFLDTAHMGDLHFDDDDGLLLLDFQRYEQHGVDAARANYIIGSRLEQCRIGAAGENFDDRGAVHFEPGRWPGTRSLVIEEARVNYDINPLMRDDDASDLADGYATWDNVAGVITWSVVDHPDKLRKGWLQRIEYTGVAGDVVANIQLRHSTAAASFAPGDDVTFSCELWGAVSGATILLAIRWEDVANADLGTTTLDITTSVRPNKQRFSFTDLVAPALTDHVRCDVRVAAIDNGDVADVYTGAWNIEKDDCATTLIHCNFGEGYAPTGVPHASTSMRNASYILLDNYVDLVSDNNTQTHQCVIRMPYDYDATWPRHPIKSFVWGFRGANDNNRIYLAWDSVNDQWVVYINGAIRLTYSDTFSAGDWRDISVICDFAGVAPETDVFKLYIDGKLVDISTTALTAPTAVVDWCVGARYDGLYPGGFWFAEYAVFDRVLTPWEVGNLHASHRPLIDFFDNVNGFTMPGTAAGVWQITGPRSITLNAAYEEVDDTTTGDSRLTFAGLWVRSPVFFEASLQNNAGGTTTYAMLQYYDEATAAWRYVPETELQVTGVIVNRVRSIVPLCIPLQECEYRVMQHSDGVNNSMLFKARILVQPGAEDNL